MNAVSQAVDLLRARRDEAIDQLRDLQIEVAQIEQALKSLGHGTGLTGTGLVLEPKLRTTSPTVSVPLPMPDGSVVEPPQDSGSSTVTGAVREILESKYGPWSPATVRDMLAGTPVQGDRPDKIFSNAVRTAFHSLRKQGIARADSHGATVAVKWDLNAETPAATGVSDGEGPSDGLSRKEGGSVNGTAHPGRDSDAVGSAPDHGHGFRASMNEVLSS